MSRYATRAGKPLYVETPLWEEDERNSLVPNIHVDGSKKVDTGLVSCRGEPIYRLAAPIGFGRENEW